MADHTLKALVGAGANYIAFRSQRLSWVQPLTPDEVLDRFYTGTGLDAYREPEQFRRWVGHKIMMMDQNMQDPFGGEAA
jgi:hypothetical protein